MPFTIYSVNGKKYKTSFAELMADKKICIKFNPAAEFRYHKDYIKLLSSFIKDMNHREFKLSAFQAIIIA